MQERYQPGQVVMGNWTIIKSIGQGSYGRVYEIVRSDFGTDYHAALKVITIPENEAEIKIVLEEGMSIESARAYFYTIVEEIVSEFALMFKVQGTANVVGYVDHAVIPHESGIGWDILIRMELLTPLLTYAYQHPFSRHDIIRLGIDMCRALELCQRYNIIHRDIKPENIFVSENGDFKLGDFGIARTIEKTSSGLSKKGTYNYMAPEIYRGEEYGFSVDTYSLGIVLYRLLNKNRVPFMPEAPTPITYSHREASLTQRMRGVAMEKPFYHQGRLPEIVLKSCSFSPKERYSSPQQMRQELESIQYDEVDGAVIYPIGDDLQIEENLYIATGKSISAENQLTEEATISVFDSNVDTVTADNDGKTQQDNDGTTSMFASQRSQQKPTTEPQKATVKKPWLLPVVIAIATLVVIGIGYIFYQSKQAGKDETIAKQDTLMEGGVSLPVTRTSLEPYEEDASSEETTTSLPVTRTSLEPYEES